MDFDIVTHVKATTLKMSNTVYFFQPDSNQVI